MVIFIHAGIAYIPTAEGWSPSFPRSLTFADASVGFAVYDATQLRDILDYRVEQALYPNVLGDAVIPLYAALATQRNGDARYALDLLSTAADLCDEEGRTTVTEEDVRRAERFAEVSLLRREVARLSPHQKALLECVYSKEGKQSPTEVYREFNNIMRLSDREQDSHKTLSALVAELELYGYVEVERKGRGRGVALIFIYIRLAQLNGRRCWMRSKT